MKTFAWKKVAIASMAVVSLSALAADDKASIRILVGFAPGGNVDIAARLLAEELRTTLGRNVLVENRVGAGGRLAAQALKTAPADGTNYLFSPDSWAIFPTIMLTESQLRYKYERDMAPVARIASYPLALFASNASGITSAADLAKKVKANPELAMYGSSGSGSITEFLGILMSREVGTKLTVVPFKGASEIKTMLMGGQVPLGIMSPSDVFAENSRIMRPLGLISEKRSPLAPHIPTLAEQGINVTHGNAFMGLWASSKAPVAERSKMEAAVKTILEKPDFRSKLAAAYLEADYASSTDLDKQVRDLIAYWKPVVAESGFKPS